MANPKTTAKRKKTATTCSTYAADQLSALALAMFHLYIGHHTTARTNPHSALSYHIVPVLSDKTHKEQHSPGSHHDGIGSQRYLIQIFVEPMQPFYEKARPASSPAAPMNPASAVPHNNGVSTSSSLSTHTESYCSTLSRYLPR